MSEYQAYIDKQKEKTTDPRRREKWLGEEWEMKIAGFRTIFLRYVHLLHDVDKALCCGARTGQEVEALLRLGVPEAKGMDLVPCLPYVEEGDIHNLKYEDNEFDFVFTNVFDHALYPEKFCSEMMRVTKPGGLILINFQVEMASDKYTVTEIASVKNDVLPLLSGADVLVNMPIPMNIHAMNWELLVRTPFEATEES